MLDLINLNIDGSVGGMPLSAKGSASPATVKRTATPKRPVTDATRFARKMAKAFNSLEDFNPEFAAEFWDNTSDAIKMRVYEFLCVLHEEAVKRGEDGMLFTTTEEHLYYMATERQSNDDADIHPVD